VPEIARRVCADQGLAVDLACLERQLPVAEAYLRGAVRAAPQTWADNQAINEIWAGYFNELLQVCASELGAGALADLVRQVVAAFDHYASYALYPDVLPVVRALHARGYTLGVISDWGLSLWPILGELGLTRYFDFAVISAALRHAKPHPWLFETALRRADAIPDYTLHVGDSYVLDVLGARSVGITAILIDRRGKLDPAAIDVPVIRDFYGLLDLLDIPRDKAIEASAG
jgi:HAD superfamily hydrolase (TIGR01549 family)